MGVVARYELLEKIGAGGMAEVHLAEAHAHDGSKLRLVVKQIHPHYSKDPEYKRMFMDEARIAGVLDHPNIVRVLDVGQMDDRLFIALEHVDGRDLQTVLRSVRAAKKLVPIEVALYVTSEILRALHHAHTRKLPDGAPLRVVHRDITPQNVLVSKAGAVKVTDFGLAKASVRVGQTVAGVIKGNIRYMAPEQVGAREIDARVDIYAAGMILHALLSGKHPFEDEPVVSAIRRCLSGDVPRPSQANPTIPRIFDDMVMKAVAENPAQRYQTAALFLEAILDNAGERALSKGKEGLSELVRVAELPNRLPPSPRANSIVARLGPLIAEATGESLFRTHAGRSAAPPPANASEPRTIGGHSAAISALAMFPDGKRVVTASADQTLRIWSIPQSREERCLRGHDAAVTACAVSPDGQAILSGGRDNRVRLWNSMGAALRAFEAHQDWVSAVGFSRDGRFAISGGADRLACVWDIAARRAILTLPGHRDTVSAVGFSPDGQFALTGSLDGIVRVWDLRTGELRTTFESESETDSVVALTISEDGTVVGTGGADAVVRLWDFHSAVQLRTFVGHREPITGLAISRNLKVLLSASYDATIRTWDVEHGLDLRRLIAKAPVSAVGLAPDATWAAVGADRTLSVFPL